MKMVYVFINIMSFLPLSILGLLIALFTHNFFSPVLICIFVLSGITSLILTRPYFKKLNRKSIRTIDIVALLLVTSVSLINVIFFHEPFSGGRDDGVYANLALNIARTGSYFVPLETAKTYPGFVKTADGITVPFYLGYSTWIAALMKLFGTQAIYFSNSILLWIGYLSFYFILSYLTNRSNSILGLLLLMLNFPFIWFARRVFTENLFFSLIWFSMLALFTYIHQRKTQFLWISLINLNILLLVRVESVLLAGLFYIFLGLNTLFTKKKFNIITICILIISLLPAIYYYYFIDNAHYVDKISTTVSRFFINGLTKSVVTSSNIDNTTSVTGKKNILEFNLPYFSFTQLQLYNIYFYVPFVILTLLLLLKQKEKKLTTIFAGLFLILGISFYYLINPSINLDQPWFLRRYIPVIIPFSILCFSYFVFHVRKISLTYLIFPCLIIIEIISVLPIATFKEYSGALKQLEAGLKNRIPNNSLILVDYVNLGHYKLAEPLYFVLNYPTAAITPNTINKLVGTEQIETASLYSDQSFHLESCDICKYEQIFILTKKSQITSYSEQVGTLIPITQFSLSYSELEKTCELFRITQNATFDEMANIPIDEALAYCLQRPHIITSFSETVGLYILSETDFNRMKTFGRYKANKSYL